MAGGTQPTNHTGKNSMNGLQKAAVATALMATGTLPLMGDTASESDARLGEWGIATANISQSVEPGDDFFTCVNAGWLESTEIPPGFSRWGAFNELRILSEERV